jgi:hypothetical protein
MPLALQLQLRNVSAIGGLIILAAAIASWPVSF